MMQALLKKIESHTVKIGIVGVGYVGLPMAIEMSKHNEVIAFDTDAEKIKMLNTGKSYVDDIEDDVLVSQLRTGRLVPTSDETDLSDVECYIVCVPTPLNINKQPELKYIISATTIISKYLHKGNVVVFESTTYPGTTVELIKPLLEKTGLQCDNEFFLAFSPERVDPGNSHFRTSNTPKVVGGTSCDATKIAAKLYEANLDCEIFPVSSPTVAEMSKILENTYRNINIGLIDEFAIICNRMNIDIWEVIDAAKTKPFGFHPFYPGPGVGGHCIPLDPLYLSWKVKEYGIDATMIEASDRIIEHMPEYVVNRVSEILNDLQKSINGANILALGVAYKADISDCRESPAVKIIERLIQKKACVSVIDPFVDCFTIKSEKHFTIDMSDVQKSEYDMVILLVDHSCIDYSRLLSLDIPIFDTRNAMRAFRSNKIIKL